MKVTSPASASTRAAATPAPTGNLRSSTPLLASATFTNETASGWQQVNFSVPVQITAGTVYVASYHTNVGHYADDINYFTSSHSNGPLTALADGASGSDGVYAYGSNSTFPTNGWQASNYWVDVVFTDPPPSGSKASAVVAAPSATTTPAVVTPSTTAVITTPSSKQFNQVLSSSGSVFVGNPFLSTVLDTSQDNGQAATWDKIFVPKADMPSGVNPVVEVRTGNTAMPDSTWSAWTAVANGGAVPKRTHAIYNPCEPEHPIGENGTVAG